MIDSKFLLQEKYKNETIKEQFFIGKNLHIVTFHDGIWSLYNYTQKEKVGTSKDRSVLLNKIDIEG